MENELAGHLIIEEESIEDSNCWGITNNGKFSVRSAYDLITGMREQPLESYWETIWKLEVPHRIRAFLWLVSHSKIMSNTKRVRRGFTTNEQCDLCLHPIEDVNHIFRKCKESRGI